MNQHAVPVVRTVTGLRRVIGRWHAADKKIALVPTMGALHDGHVSLVRQGRRKADRVVVSIFVNPAQFAPTEDFAKYPRTFPSDRKKLGQAKADLIWAPTVDVMYPSGFSTQVVPAGPAVAGLEDRFRPHFFGGVATVVTKLFTQVLPDIALFGEKDYQQLMVIRRMAADLDLPVNVMGCPTIREADGLAMSSRNIYLSPSERQTAPTLHRVMQHVAVDLRRGWTTQAAIEKGADAIRSAGFDLDYLEARHARTLEPILTLMDGPIRILVAARIGPTRLIDNIAV